MKRLRPLPLRIASIWLSLAVALLSSLMPGGPPRTIAVGSAFNPATTAVVLQPGRAELRVVAEHVRRDDDPKDGQGEAIAAVPLPLISAGSATELLSQPRAATASLPLSPVLDGSPRGPPLP